MTPQDVFLNFSTLDNAKPRTSSKIKVDANLVACDKARSCLLEALIR